MYSFSFAVLGLLAILLLATSKAEDDVFEAIKNIDKVPEGFLHIADNGVARSYDENDVIIDFVRLSNEQLMQLLPQLPAPYQKEMNHLHSVFDGVNGLDVVDENQLRDPPSWLRPAREHEASKRSVSSHSRNPTYDIEASLEPRDYYCVGQACTTSAACIFLGCSGCIYLDAVLPGGGGSAAGNEVEADIFSLKTLMLIGATQPASGHTESNRNLKLISAHKVPNIVRLS